MVGLQILYTAIAIILLIAIFWFYEKYIISVKASTKYTLQALGLSVRYSKILFAVSILKDEERPQEIDGWESLFKALLESWIYACLILSSIVIAGAFAFSLFPQLYELSSSVIFLFPVAIAALYAVASGCLSAVFSTMSIKQLSELNIFWKRHFDTVKGFCLNGRIDDIKRPSLNIGRLLLLISLFLVVAIIVSFAGSNIWVLASCVILYLILWIVDALKKRRKNKRRTKKVDTTSITWHIPTDVGAELEKRIQELCITHEVTDIEFIIKDVSQRIAHSSLRTDGPAAIIISTGCMSSFSSKEGLNLDSILYVMAHEICHIAYKDSRRIPIRRGLAALVMVLFLISIFVMLFSIPLLTNQLLSVLAIVASSVMLFLFNYVISIVCNERYWRAIAELRADSKAVIYCNCNLDVARKTLMSADYLSDEKDKIEDFNDKNAFYQNFIRMNNIDGHPPITSRTDFLTKKWGIKSYIRLFFLFKKWHRQGKGWIGY